MPQLMPNPTPGLTLAVNSLFMDMEGNRVQITKAEAAGVFIGDCMDSKSKIIDIRTYYTDGLYTISSEAENHKYHKRHLIHKLESMEDPIYLDLRKRLDMSREERMEAFALTDLKSALPHIRIGFELETMKSSEGPTEDGKTPNMLTYTDAEHRIPEIAALAAKEQLPTILKNWRTLSPLITQMNSFITAIPEAKRDALVEQIGLNDVEKVCEFFGLKLDTVMRAIQGNLQSRMQNDGLKLFFANMAKMGITIKRDGSVTGFEFTTQGPKTVKEFSQAIQEVLKHKHQVNEGCSFHIHASIDNMKHKYGARLCQGIYEFLLVKAWDRIPPAVKRRWNSAKTDEFARPLVDPVWDSTTKYRFVAFRGNTWEFRCWGNIATYEETMLCAQLTIEALQHGYKILLGKEQLLFTGVSDFTNLCKTNQRETFLNRISQQLDAA